MTAEISPDVLAAAIEAAARAAFEEMIRHRDPMFGESWSWDEVHRDTRMMYIDTATRIVTAAAPVIAAAVEAETERRAAEELRAEIDAHARQFPEDQRFRDGLSYVWSRFLISADIRADIARARSAVPANPTEENR